SKQKPVSSDDDYSEKIETLVKKIKHQCSIEKLSFIHSFEINPKSDIYIEVNEDKKLQIGFRPISNNLSSKIRSSSDISFDNLHWVTIESYLSEPVELLSQLLIFMIGLVCIISQIGTYMTDMNDFKIALQKGNKAKF